MEVCVFIYLGRAHVVCLHAGQLMLCPLSPALPIYTTCCVVIFIWIFVIFRLHTVHTYDTFFPAARLHPPCGLQVVRFTQNIQSYTSTAMQHFPTTQRCWLTQEEVSKHKRRGVDHIPPHIKHKNILFCRYILHTYHQP